MTSHNTYAEAEAAVDRLSDHGFPVAGTQIVGRDLQFVEQVTARQTYLRAVGVGVGVGAWIGLLVGLFLGIFAPGAVSFLAAILWGIAWGAVGGAIYGLVSHAMLGGRRDFVAISQLLADHYDVLVEPEQADKAREILGTHR
ncbi:MAG: general stress protein [Micromonosporaceae bacterium]